MRVAKAARDRPTRDELVIEHVDVVKSIANRLARRLPPSVETKDLVSIGILGLLDSAGRYRHGLGVPFDAFARRRVLGAMLDELRSLDRVPRSLRRMGRELEETLGRLRHELRREPTDIETADALNMSQEEYQQAVAQLRYLEVGLHDVETSQCGEWMIALVDDRERPDEQFEHTEMCELLASAQAQLPERERHIMSLYYQEGWTLKKIGETVGLCESRISQLRTAAIAQLRALMRQALGVEEPME